MKNSTKDNLKLHLKLYIAGRVTHIAAINNLLKINSDYLGMDANIEIIDLYENPQIAIDDRIRVLPQLVRVSPEPLGRLFGDLSDLPKVLLFLNIEGEKLRNRNIRKTK